MSEIPQPAMAAQQGAAPPLLEVERVTIRFGGIIALDGVTFSVANGRIVGLIGPNGAGKTTLFNCLSRLYRSAQGGCAPSDIAALGIGRTFQSPTLFASMSVLDNVKVGAHARSRNGLLLDAATLPSTRREERDLDQAARTLLGIVGLGDSAERPVAGLTFGARKRVELARALAVKPSLLLLDEPAGGLNHEEVSELGALIRSIRDRLTVTILLVEHHMGLVMSLSDQVVVLNFGRVIANGMPDEVRSDPVVTEAYLGARH
jgi:branched-chain amino acid transport system ATP-binding protein